MSTLYLLPSYEVYFLTHFPHAGTSLQLSSIFPMTATTESFSAFTIIRENNYLHRFSDNMFDIKGMIQQVFQICVQY